jgi:hypothetical protein
MGYEIKVSEKKDILDPDSVSFEERRKYLDKEEQKLESEKKREKQSPYSNWYQFNKDHTKEMIWLVTNHPKAQAILLFLLDQMDAYNAVMCSYQVFQDALGISKQTITRSIKILKDYGFIAIYKSGTSNVYVINDDLAWNSWGNNRKYCKFPASIVLSANENEEYLKQIQASKIKRISIKDKTEEIPD